MTVLVVSGLAGAVVAALLGFALRGVFEHPSLARTNLLGRPVPTAGGVVVVLATLLGYTALNLVVVLNDGRPGWLPSEALARWEAITLGVVAYGFLGVIDDLLGDGSSRGFAGHLSALRSGVLTTGALKLFGGGAVAVLLASMVSVPGEPPWLLFVDAALVALAANLANLLDRAPGRLTKVAAPVAVVLVVVAPSAAQAGVGSQRSLPVGAVFVVGAGIGLLVPELRERIMLGDTGANAVGVALGLGVVTACAEGARIAVVVVLLALNLASERVSFSRVIASTPGLRHLDELGRRTE